MYHNPCKHCENFGHCMSMANMPMMDMPMMDMPMENMPMMNMPMMDMPMENMPMMNMPMMDMSMENMPMMEDADEDLKALYPKIYMKMYPMVKHHCNMLKAKHGTMYCPSREEMEKISEEICDRYDDDSRYSYDNDDDYDDLNDDDNMRQRRRRRRRRRRRNVGQDLVKILLINELIGGRGRVPGFGYGYGYGY
jgi:hypothetical protein